MPVSIRPRFAAIIASTILLTPLGLAAQEAPVKTRSFVADFGFVNAAGNTSITTINVGDKFTANTVDKKLVFTQTLGVVYGSTDGDKTAENYRLQTRLDRHLSGKVFLFGLLGWDRNTFGGVSRRFEETAGLAFKPLSRPKDELDVELGLSVFQQRNTVAVAGTFDDNYLAGRLAGLYKHSFSKTAIFNQSLELIPDFDVSKDFRLNSETALVAPVSTNFGLKLSYVIRFDNLPGLKPAPNPTNELFAKTDRFLTAGITLSY
jgi:putative salt-induced outer membrane protein